MSGSLANTQMLGLSQHGFTNEQIAEDLGYDTDVVDLVIPKEDDDRTVAERFESLGLASTSRPGLTLQNTFTIKLKSRIRLEQPSILQLFPRAYNKPVIK